jgi:predicted GNAT family acetyltransferase
MPETIPVVMNEAQHRFEAKLGDAPLAFAEYRLREDEIILPHTVVPEEFSGKGVASQLAKAALSYAREQGLRVIPTCSFMAGYITKHPEWHDLVHPDHRARLGIEG